MSSLPKTSLPKTLDANTASGRTIFFRADLNMPMQDGKISDTTRMTRLAPAISALAESSARVVVASHLGRPKGRRDPNLSLKPVAEALAECLARPVNFVADIAGEPAQNAIRALQDGGILMLENLRFDAGEESNDNDFAARLMEGIDIYVNDAFACSHRHHASICAAAGMRPAFAGALMLEELQALNQALTQPTRPLVAVVGGAKISSKLGVLNHLVEQVDALILGGGMANTFLLDEGVELGASLVEADLLEEVQAVKATAKASGCQLILPKDGVVATKLEPNAPHRVAHFDKDKLRDDEMILDIGKDSVAAAKQAIAAAKTLIWNGPMGAFEIPPFDNATTKLAQYVGERSKAGDLVSIAGGGDTLAALNHANAMQHFTYISTAGGAFLEWLEGKALPGVEALLAHN